MKNDEGKVKQGPQRDLKVQSSVQLLIWKRFAREGKVLEKLATRSTWSELVDTGEELGLLPGAFQQRDGHKRDVSCSCISSFLSPGHEMATARSQRVFNKRSASTTQRKTFRETRRGSYFLGLTDK